MMIQLNPEIEVLTPRGEGYAIALTDYGQHINPMLMVSICDTGELIYVTLEECRRMGNPAPDIPNPRPFTGRNVK